MHYIADRTAVQIALLVTGFQTLTRLGLALGIERTRLSRGIHGWIPLTSDERSAIAAALHVSERDLWQPVNPADLARPAAAPQLTEVGCRLGGRA